MRTVKVILIMVPLVVLLGVGLTASFLSDFFSWVDDVCRDWFKSIYGA
jgi:hypothetical protein